MMRKITYVKYPNRRIYDTELSEYVPFSSIKKRLMEGNSILVINHKTKEDVTREVLLSMILEQSAPGNEFFTETLMRMIIRFYGNPLQDNFRAYLDQVQATLNSFLSNANDSENY